MNSFNLLSLLPLLFFLLPVLSIIVRLFINMVSQLSQQSSDERAREKTLSAKLDSYDQPDSMRSKLEQERSRLRSSQTRNARNQSQSSNYSTNREKVSIFDNPSQYQGRSPSFAEQAEQRERESYRQNTGYSPERRSASEQQKATAPTVKQLSSSKKQQKKRQKHQLNVQDELLKAVVYKELFDKPLSKRRYR